MAQSGISFAALLTILSKSESSLATFQRHNKNLKTYTQIKDCSALRIFYYTRRVEIQVSMYSIPVIIFTNSFILLFKNPITFLVVYPPGDCWLLLRFNFVYCKYRSIYLSCCRPIGLRAILFGNNKSHHLSLTR
jgi:hypothetical protein